MLKHLELGVADAGPTGQRRRDPARLANRDHLVADIMCQDDHWRAHLPKTTQRRHPAELRLQACRQLLDSTGSGLVVQFRQQRKDPPGIRREAAGSSLWAALGAEITEQDRLFGAQARGQRAHEDAPGELVDHPGFATVPAAGSSAGDICGQAAHRGEGRPGDDESDPLADPRIGGGE